MQRTASKRTKEPASVSADLSITDRLPQLVESLLNMAVGIRVQEGPGKPIYEIPPNRLAAEYLINRVLGKPTERIQTSSTASSRELEDRLKELKDLNTDELIELHRKTIGES